MKEEMLEMLMWARVSREKRHAKRSSQDIDGLGSEGGGDEVRVGGNALITVKSLHAKDANQYIYIAIFIAITDIGFDCLPQQTIFGFECIILANMG